MINMDLHNKVAVITGGSSGIGKGVVLALAEAGCSVIAVARGKEKLKRLLNEVKGSGADVRVYPADVSSETDVKSLLEYVVSTFGRLDILCNIAGITIKKPILYLEFEEWNKVVNINLCSVFLCCKYLGRLIIDSRKGTDDYGKVINIASVGSFQGIPLSSAYCASKGGVHTLTKELATEWASVKVTVNAIVPGYIETPLSASVLKEPDAYSKVCNSIPMNALGKVQDVANAILFLVSQSSNYMTGADLPVDGGFLSSAYTM